jgi:hypothetical protein
MKKNTIIGVILIVVAALGIFLLTRNSSEELYESDSTETEMESVEMATSTVEVPEKDLSVVSIGQSAGGRDIVAYKHGNGDKEILFIGGVHGGYSWNTALLGYQLSDYLEANPEMVPGNVTATIIPVLNPDGLEKVVGTYGQFSASDFSATDSEKVAGRFNDNGVDLNRNFDCDWQSVGTWQNREVDGGDNVFSEPESIALRNYVTKNNIEAAVVYYSSAGGVFASSCHNGILSETLDLTNAYAEASGYPAYEEFDFYEVTGDMVNWLAKIEVPAISILLSNHEDIEESKNIRGVQAVLDYYAE